MRRIVSLALLLVDASSPTLASFLHLHYEHSEVNDPKEKESANEDESVLLERCFDC